MNYSEMKPAQLLIHMPGEELETLEAKVETGEGLEGAYYLG